MKKYFVFSDVHSYYNELMKALTEKGFDINNPNHYIISCGDACDRGPDAIKVLDFFNNLYSKNRAILIRGNHEDLMEEAIRRAYFMTHDIHNKTTETAVQLTGIQDPDLALLEMSSNTLWNTYIHNCIDYYELNNYIFVHGWIPLDTVLDDNENYKDLPDIYKPTKLVMFKDWKNPFLEKDWEDARWLNGMKCWYMGLRPEGKTVVCGHFHTSWGHSLLHNDGVQFLNKIETFYIDPKTGKQEPHVNYGPFIDDGIIALDACTAISHKVNCIVIESE